MLLEDRCIMISFVDAYVHNANVGLDGARWDMLLVDLYSDGLALYRVSNYEHSKTFEWWAYN